MKYISKEEIEKPRNGKELLIWVEGKIEEISKEAGGRNAILHLKGGCKELIEEILPIAIWANQQEDPTLVTLEPAIGSQNYDAFVIDKQKESKTYHLEVTQAHMGVQEHWRRLHLLNEGWAPGPLQEMKCVEKGPAGLKIKPGRMANTLEGLIRQTKDLIYKALDKKATKNYPTDTQLIVAFEDYLIYKSEGIEEQLKELACKFINKNTLPFTHIHLVGNSRRLIVTVKMRHA